MRINQLLSYAGSDDVVSIEYRVPEHNPRTTKPSLATVREIILDQSGAVLNLRYSRAAYTVDLNIVGGLSVVLASLAQGSFQMNDDPAPKPEYKTQLSLSNNKQQYIILVLANQNLQFSRNRDPISLGWDAYDPQVYSEARRVDGNGAVVTRGEERDGCRIAYFIADGEYAGARYSDGFNLHLDLIDKDWEGKPSYIPVMIDPDVRYPGGSGP